MSDPTVKQFPLTGRGESPSSTSSADAEPPESHVQSGSLRVGAQSEKSVRFEEADINQLALALAARMAEPKARWSFGELAARWLASVRRVRLQDEQRALVMLKQLWGLTESTLTPASISEWFAQLSAMSYSPVSVNKYRSAGRLVIREAQANGQWGSHNPFDLVRRLREPRRKYELLTAAELRAVLPHLTPEKRRMVRVSVHLGLRSGELFALEKQDVDFAAGVVRVHRSHGRATTKTGRARTVPLLGAIAADLLDAIRESPSDLVFPDAGGKRMRADSKMSRFLRTAMGKAGVVTGFAFTCRHTGCDYRIEFSGPCDDCECPHHGWKLWRTPLVRAVRWYDLRHMAASFHRAAGADKLAVKIMLGHTGADVTDDIYTHVTDAWLRGELSKFVL